INIAAGGRKVYFSSNNFQFSKHTASVAINFLSGKMTELFNKLLSYGLCKLCAFRYMGVRDPAAYDCSDTQTQRVKSYRGDIIIDREEDEAPAQKIKKSNCCLTCLGLLQQLTENDAIDMVHKSIILCQWRNYHLDNAWVSDT
ncbi:hypothetical protein B566_EDAN009403, partial [Ephemera danica]